MSFKSFIENIEELVVLPTLEKCEGGYFYPEKYQNKLYRHGSSLMYITATATDELQIPLIEALYGSIESGITDDVREAISNSSDSAKFETVNIQIEQILEQIDKLQSEGSERFEAADSDKNSIIDDFCTMQDRIANLENSKPSINLEIIQKIIDKKFEDAPARVGKIKISTLSMLKESGFSIDEISELAKSDLI